MNRSRFRLWRRLARAQGIRSMFWWGSGSPTEQILLRGTYWNMPGGAYTQSDSQGAARGDAAFSPPSPCQFANIVELNADLVQLLLDRDELYMQQDSFLVDIDDLNRSVNQNVLYTVCSQCSGRFCVGVVFVRTKLARIESVTHVVIVSQLKATQRFANFRW